MRTADGDGKTYRLRLRAYCGQCETIGDGLTHAEALALRGRTMRRAVKASEGQLTAEHTGDGNDIELTDDGSGMIPDSAGVYSVELYPASANCRWCGSDYQPDRPLGRNDRAFCCECCAAAYSGAECDCPSCDALRAEEAGPTEENE